MKCMKKARKIEIQPKLCYNTNELKGIIKMSNNNLDNESVGLFDGERKKKILTPEELAEQEWQEEFWKNFKNSKSSDDDDQNEQKYEQIMGHTR